MPCQNEVESGFEPSTSENIREVDFEIEHDYYCSNPLFVSPEIRGPKNVRVCIFAVRKIADWVDSASYDQAAALKDLLEIHSHLVKIRAEPKPIPPLVFYRGWIKMKIDDCDLKATGWPQFHLTDSEWHPEEYIIHFTIDFSSTYLDCQTRIEEPSGIVIEEGRKSFHYKPGSHSKETLTVLPGDPVCRVSYKDVRILGGFVPPVTSNRTVQELMEEAHWRLFAAFQTHITFYDWDIRDLPLEKNKCVLARKIAELPINR